MNSTKRFLSVVLVLTMLLGTMAVFANASDEISSAVGVVRRGDFAEYGVHGVVHAVSSIVQNGRYGERQPSGVLPLL